MTKGRKPKPTEMKLLAGNPGKRELPTPPDIEKGDIEIPEEIADKDYELAQQEWLRQAPLLSNAGIYKRVDRTSLIAYCIAYQNYIKACDGIKEYGYLIRTKNNLLTLNPHVKTQKIFFEQMTRMATEFGLTPSSRVRLGSFGGEEEDDEDLIKKMFG